MKIVQGDIYKCVALSVPNDILFTVMQNREKQEIHTFGVFFFAWKMTSYQKLRLNFQLKQLLQLDIDVSGLYIIIHYIKSVHIVQFSTCILSLHAKWRKLCITGGFCFAVRGIKKERTREANHVWKDLPKGHQLTVYSCLWPLEWSPWQQCFQIWPLPASLHHNNKPHWCVSGMRWPVSRGKLRPFAQLLCLKRIYSFSVLFSLRWR